nr:twin-arginine translocase TatA/TatE family subunit [Pedobacter panaciterrae]
MLHNTLLGALGTPEIAVILVVVLLLFGGKKIPELMSGLGKGIREFNNGKDGVEDPAEKSEGTNSNQPK